MNNKYFQKVRSLVFAFAIASGLLWPINQTAALTPKAETGLQPNSTGIPTNQIIIKYKPTVGAAIAPMQAKQMDRLSIKAGISLQYVRAMSGQGNVLRLPKRLPLEQVQEISNQLMALPEVEYAEPDQILQPTLITPNDAEYPNQWDYYGPWGINAPAAWDITTGSSNIVVAVIDTGITNHADLSGRTVNGYDFISNTLNANDLDGRDSDPSDPGDWVTDAERAPGGDFDGCPPAENSSWHGTHVAGTIGALSNNGTGVTGINWSSKILPVRVLGKCGNTTSDIVDGMYWAAGIPVLGVPDNPNPARVLNLSLGGNGFCESNSTMQTAINDITSIGAVVVVAAGNESTNASNAFPANCNNVITVAATNSSGWQAFYSNYGSTVEISAPGGDSIFDPGILSTSNTGTTEPVSDTYAYKVGTSMAAPHVSGVVSLMLSHNPSLSPNKVLQILQNTAQAFPQGGLFPCNTSICGAGIVDAGAAVAATDMADVVITNLTLSPANPQPNETFSITATVQNQGNLATGSVPYVDIYFDQDPLTNINPATGCPFQSDLYSGSTLSGLDPGQSATATIEITNGLPGGSSQIYAYVDADCTITESNEDNNRFGPVSVNIGNDDFSLAKTINSIPFIDPNVNTTSATTAVDDPNILNCNAGQGFASLWYSYTPSANGIVYLDTLGSNYDTLIAVWTGAQGNLTGVACNNDANGTLQSALPLNVTTGITYYIEIVQYAPSPPAQIGGLLQFHATSFGDVQGNYWAWRWIEGLYKAGITGGCATSPSRLYCPDNTVTRAQMAIFLLRGIHSSSYAAPPVGTSTGFGDVPVSYWAAAWIKQLAAEGITSGCGSGNYCPESAVTRAQMAVFLLKSKYGAAYSPPPVGSSTGFSDVPSSYWASAWIKQLAAEGITSGCGVGLYCPESLVNRAQMAVFLDRTFSLPQLP